MRLRWQAHEARIFVKEEPSAAAAGHARTAVKEEPPAAAAGQATEAAGGCSAATERRAPAGPGRTDSLTDGRASNRPPRADKIKRSSSAPELEELDTMEVGGWVGDWVRTRMCTSWHVLSGWNQ
jgi:hypothetical protein